MGNKIWDDYYGWIDKDERFPRREHKTIGYGWGKSKYKSSLGWGGSKLYDTTSYYSWGDSRTTSLKDENAIVELLKKTYKAARDMIVILDFPFDVKLHFTSDDKCVNKEQRRIFIPTTVLSTKKTDQEKINIMCALGIHEALHLKYTEFTVLNTFLGTYKSTDNIIRYIANTVEDGRIEDRLLSERPGYLEFIEKKKEWEIESFPAPLGTPEQNLILDALKFMRYPDSIDQRIIDAHPDLFDFIREKLTTYPDSTKKMCLVSKSIYDFIDAYIDEHVKKNVICKENINNILSRFTESLQVNYGFDKDSMIVDKNLVSSKINTVISKLVSGQSEKGIEENTYFEKMKKSSELCRAEYHKSLERVRKYIPSIRKVVKGIDKNYDFTIPGCRSGILDTTKLAEAYQGVPQVYLRQGHVVTNKTTVCVLIDESGSMNTYTTSRTRRFTLARDTGVLLNEALGNLPGVDLFIYGYSADETRCGSTNLRIYKEDQGNVTDKYVLGDISARVENRDGTSILECAQRVRKYTQSHCIMFVISDGSPCANDYWGEPAIKDTEEKIKKAEKLDFDIIGIIIGTDYSYAEDMYGGKAVDLRNDISNLPKKLGNIIKNSIVANKKTVVS